MSLTPDGHKYDPVDPTNINNSWIQSKILGSAYQFPNIAKYAVDSAKSPYLTQFCLMACAAVNKLCNRKFNKQTIDQIYPNEMLYFREYKIFPLNNKPLISVSNVWVQVTNQFATVDPTYFQVLTEESVLKILPTYSIYVQTTLPVYASQTSTNIWVRYISGYNVDYSGSNTTNDVPLPVQLATSMYLDYLYSRFDLQGGVTSYSTQTFSQTQATADNDPILSSVKQLLDPYIVHNVR